MEFRWHRIDMHYIFIDWTIYIFKSMQTTKGSLMLKHSIFCMIIGFVAILIFPASKLLGSESSHEIGEILAQGTGQEGCYFGECAPQDNQTTTRGDGIVPSGINSFSLNDGETIFLLNGNQSLTYRRTANPRCVFSVLNGKNRQHCVGHILKVEDGHLSCDLIYLGTKDEGSTADFSFRCPKA